MYRATKEKMDQVRAVILVMKNSTPPIKPNFSALAEEYGMTRQTVAKIWADPNPEQRERKPKKSQFDPYEEEIRDQLVTYGITMASSFRYFQNKYADLEDNPFNCYNSFKSYVTRKQFREARAQHLKEVKQGHALKAGDKDSQKDSQKEPE